MLVAEPERAVLWAAFTVWAIHLTHHAMRCESYSIYTTLLRYKVGSHGSNIRQIAEHIGLTGQAAYAIVAPLSLPKSQPCTELRLPGRTSF
jgi:hypothetical protein